MAMSDDYVSLKRRKKLGERIGKAVEVWRLEFDDDHFLKTEIDGDDDRIHLSDIAIYFCEFVEWLEEDVSVMPKTWIELYDRMNKFRRRLH